MNAKDIAVESKITFSRNVKGYPFPSKLRDTRANVIASGVYEALAKNGGYELYKIAQMSEPVTRRLRERGLISDRLIQSPYGSAIVSSDESVSVMINEEDAIVEQYFGKGDCLSELYEKANKTDDIIGAKEEFCFHPRLGYLTSCPDSVGTGMHASVTLFLPALVLTKSLQSCASSVSRLNISIKSVYDDSVEAYLFTATNQQTLGFGEDEIIDLVEKAVNHLIEAEERARKMLKISSEAQVRDKSMRAFGIMKNAYSMPATEMVELFSWVKLGAYYGYVSVDTDKVEQLVKKLMPAAVAEAGAENEDVYRAELLRKELN